VDSDPASDEFPGFLAFQYHAAPRQPYVLRNRKVARNEPEQLAQP